MRRYPKGWTSRYWDILDQLYWVPDYIGLKSIPKKFWLREGERVSVPRNMTNPNGPLYRRLRKGDEYWDYIQRIEEPFNHILELTLGIVPGDASGQILSPLAGLVDGHDFVSLGRELNTRYEWAAMDNTTQPDAFLTAPDALLMLEIKFGAKTSRDQFTKYLALAISEEAISGQRREIALLYILPGDAPAKTISDQLEFTMDGIELLDPEKLIAEMRNETVRAFLEDNRTALKNALSRIRLHAVSWQQVHDGVLDYSHNLPCDVGGRTLKNILEGFAEAIRLHPRSGVTANAP